MDERLNKDQMLFTSLIMMFQTAAMQHMGKLKNPITDKIERDIDQAKISIDILDLLQRKTQGNLEEYENKLLTSVLQDLRLNYVQERDKKVETGQEKVRDSENESENKTGTSTSNSEKKENE